jgi:hypothetical protein
MTDTPNLGITNLEAAQSQKHVTVNEGWQTLDAIVQLSVEDRNLTAPPVSPTDGDAYIVAAGATGLWAGQDNNVAYFNNAAWFFHTPKDGWIAYVLDEQVHYKYTTVGGWVSFLATFDDIWGWQNFQDVLTATTPIPLTVASTWYDLTNDAAGALSTLAYGVLGHGATWDNVASELDFSSLAVGDQVRLRIDVEVTTSGANHEVGMRILLDAGGLDVPLTIISETYKAAGTYQIVVEASVTLFVAAVIAGPALIQMQSDNTGDTVKVNGWVTTTHVR